LFFFVTFVLTQVTFLFGEEFLLAILTITIILLFIELITDWFVYSNLNKQVVLIKQLTKQQIINGMLLNEIKKEYKDIEIVHQMFEKLVIDCMLSMSEKIIELFKKQVELECTEHVTNILDEAVELVKFAETEVQKQFVDELFEELQ